MPFPDAAPDARLPFIEASLPIPLFKGWLKCPLAALPGPYLPRESLERKVINSLFHVIMI